MTLIEDTRARLGALGAWLPSAPLQPAPAVERAATRRLADAGYRSIWSGEGPGIREVFAHFGDLLASVPDVVLGAGIANVWARPGRTAERAARPWPTPTPAGSCSASASGTRSRRRSTASSTGPSTGCASTCPKWTPRRRKTPPR